MEEVAKPKTPTEQLVELYLKLSTPNAVKGFNGPPAALDTTTLGQELKLVRMLKSGIERREKVLGEVLQTRIKVDNPDWVATIDQSLDQGEMPPEEATKKTVPVGESSAFMVFVGQRRLDAEKILEEMGEEWVEAHKKVVGFFQIKFPGGRKGQNDD